jgi:hypothetical protein
MNIIDNYIVRITNTSLAAGVTISEGNSQASFETPSFLRKKGKCKITVVGGNICLVDGIARLNVDSTKTILCLNSNIPQLGYFTENRGVNTVLGTCPTIYTGATTSEGYNVPFSNITPLIFTCPQLPPVIEVQRMVYKQFTLTTSGALTTNSPTIINILAADILQMSIGDTVTGTGIPPGTTIELIASETSVILNKSATQTGTKDLSVFGGSTFEELSSNTVTPFYVELDIQFYEDMPKHHIKE